MSEHNKILNIISKIRESHSLIPFIFTKGSCYNFYLILKSIYPEAECYYNQAEGHVITKINDKFYDITGEVNRESAKLLEDIFTKPERIIKQMLDYEWDMHYKCSQCGRSGIVSYI